MLFWKDAKSPLSGIAVDVTRRSPDATSDRLAASSSNANFTVNQEDAEEVFAKHSPMMEKYLVSETEGCVTDGLHLICSHLVIPFDI